MIWDPLDPSGDEARSALRRELARPEYHDTNLLRRLVDWVGGVLNGAINGASSWSALQTLAALVVVLALVLVIGLLTARTRRTRTAARRPGPVLTAHALTAADFRRRAEAAMANGSIDVALVDGFRALTRRQMERGRLDDAPGATAHEVALALEHRFPDHSTRVDESAAAFDRVMYGGRAASVAQAEAVLVLDDELAGPR